VRLGARHLRVGFAADERSHDLPGVWPGHEDDPGPVPALWGGQGREPRAAAGAGRGESWWPSDHGLLLVVLLVPGAALVVLAVVIFPAIGVLVLVACVALAILAALLHELLDW
jgi:hypothetical protein